MIRLKSSLLVLLIVIAALAGACSFGQKDVKNRVISTFPVNGAEDVFNFTPIKVQFAAPPKDPKITLTPDVNGRIETDGRVVTFHPDEEFLPNTKYSLSIAWEDNVSTASFTSVNEVAVLFEEDFLAMTVGEFPAGWQIRSNEDATPNYQVIDFPQSDSGRALRAFDGGITWGDAGHALILAPGILPLQDSTSKILVESTIWIDKDAIWRTYLFPAGSVWPPYKDIGAESATTPINHADLQRYTVQHVYDPSKSSLETFFDFVRVDSGNTKYRSDPPQGHLDYNIGIYTQGMNSSEVYWERIRVTEIATK